MFIRGFLFQMVDMHDLIQRLSQPEYLHVLLNPLPSHGTMLGIIVLVVALIARNRPAQVAALGVIFFVSCASVWWVIRYGHQGYDRVYAMSYSDAQAWLDLHAERAEQWKWIFYAAAFSALLGMLLPWKKPKTATPLAVTSLVLAILSGLAGGWIAPRGRRAASSRSRTLSFPTSGKLRSKTFQGLENIHWERSKHWDKGSDSFPMLGSWTVGKKPWNSRLFTDFRHSY